MKLLEKYINDPINTLAIPYWKHSKTAIRKDMMYVSKENYDETLYRDFDDVLYLRLQHNLLNLKLGKFSGNFFVRSFKRNENLYIHQLINECYDLEISKDYVDKLIKDETFNDILCVFLYNSKVYTIDNNLPKKNNKEKHSNRVYKPIGLVIAQFDLKTEEASIEWLCVQEKYRNKGLGKLLIEEVLLRISNVAEFATVTFPLDNQYHLESLFRNAGFTGNAVWHMLKKQ